MLMNQQYAKSYASGNRIVSEENKNKHILVNDTAQPAYQYRIDGGVYPRGTTPERCDYIVETNDPPNGARLYIIELKGSDLSKAISQVETAIRLLQTDTVHFSGFLTGGYTLYPRVIIHRYNTHSITQSEKLKLKKKYPFFVVKNSQLEETVSHPAKWAADA